MLIPNITGSMLNRPENFQRVDDLYVDLYWRQVRGGAVIAAKSQVAIVAIARNCMPHLANTLGLIEELRHKFRAASLYVYENDSDDGTAEMLDEFATEHSWATIEHATHDRPHLAGSFSAERTIALAEYRNKCVDWVSQNTPPEMVKHVVVVDMDPHGGFSIDGILNSLAWMDNGCLAAGGMASYSLIRMTDKETGSERWAHYDAWAARLNWWDDRREKIGFGWFSLLHPPVGSEPIRMYSAFGGLAVYTRDAFVASRYVGGDCEHVAKHQGMAENGYSLYLNPSSRYISILQ